MALFGGLRKRGSAPAGECALTSAAELQELLRLNRVAMLALMLRKF